MSGSARAATLFDEVAALFDSHGRETYGEGVSIAEHCLQTAALARAESADPALVVAALLHDIGHLIELRDDAFGYHKHDQSGGIWLAARTWRRNDIYARSSRAISIFSRCRRNIRCRSRAAR